jgi:SAM-dependent methyltransferase
MSLEARYNSLLEHPITQSAPESYGHLVAYRPRYLQQIKMVQRHLQGKRQTIADIGCGYGTFLYLAADIGFESFIGVDYFVKLEHTYLANLQDARVLKADFNAECFQLQIESESVDCVVSSQVFEHLCYYPLGYLEEAWRILRPGGILLFDMPNPCTIANAIRLLRGQSTLWGDISFATMPKSAVVWDVHFREYSQPIFEEIVQQLPGVEIVEKGFIGSSPHPADNLPKKLIKSAAKMTGLTNHRLLSIVQYMVLRKKA